MNPNDRIGSRDCSFIEVPQRKESITLFIANKRIDNYFIASLIDNQSVSRYKKSCQNGSEEIINSLTTLFAQLHSNYDYNMQISKISIACNHLLRRQQHQH